MNVSKRKVIIATTAMLVLSLILTVFAVSVSADENMEAVARYGVPKAIDGILDEGWDGVPVNVSECTFYDPASSTDMEVSWRVMYDNVYLYFFVEVVDSTIGDKDFEFDAWGNYYLKNSIHMMFDMGYERAASYDSNDFYIDVSCQGYFHGRGMGTTDTIKYAVVVDDDGYNVELRLDHTVFDGFFAQALEYKK